jgi:hypothetical protein|tara:strand:- start:573 stop:1595 length:1023 start_codon:yes stop_codon:yes gene_type:complete
MSKPVELFKKYFANYFWLGMVVVLFSLIVDAYALQSNENARYIEVFVSLMETVGIAIMVASIFTFASGSSEFVDRIRLLLESIVVKRNFLGNIDNEGKKEALKSLVQPSDVEKNKYPNIGDYYGYFINKTLDIGGKSVRSNYQVSSRVFFDKEVEKIAVEGNYSYRVYPSKDGFHDIVVGFSEDMDGPSKCKHIAISNPDGNRKVHDDLKFEREDHGGDVSKLAKISTSEHNQHSHLDVELKVVEYGAGHWALITFKALQPTDGFKFMLHCDDDVIIQEKAIFVVGANYYVDLSDDRKDITITCNQWINEGSGLTVLVSIPHDIADKVIDTFGCGDNSSL